MEPNVWRFSLLDWFWYSAWIAVGLAWWRCCMRVIAPHIDF
jgi:hypothetical protein